MRFWLATGAAALAVTGCGEEQQAAAPVAAVTQAASGSAAAAADRGRYLVAIMDCTGCHNTGSFSPKPEAGYLQGGTVGFEVPGLGVFWPPNLTPHPEAGLGRWSEADIVAAVTQGKRPDGRQLAPAMPWPAYSALTDQDARAIAAYLKTLPPSDRRVPNPTQPTTASAPYLTVKAPGQ
jgi:mono/diheme cytochrome c family protein